MKIYSVSGDFLFLTGKAEIRLQKLQQPASFGEEGTDWESEQPSS